MAEGDDVNAVRTREAGLPTGDDAEGGAVRQLGPRQPAAELSEVGDGLRDSPFSTEASVEMFLASNLSNAAIRTGSERP